MPKLPRECDTERVIRVFEKIGFTRRGRKSGTSHEVLKRPGPVGTVTVAHPKVYIGVLKRCLRNAGLSRQEFLQLLNEV
jgi:predicted RNA binding protein YcfA (HicA-like mRNA interferase family)